MARQGFAGPAWLYLDLRKPLDIPSFLLPIQEEKPIRIPLRGWRICQLPAKPHRVSWCEGLTPKVSARRQTPPPMLMSARLRQEQVSANCGPPPPMLMTPAPLGRTPPMPASPAPYANPTAPQPAGPAPYNNEHLPPLELT